MQKCSLLRQSPNYSNWLDEFTFNPSGASSNPGIPHFRTLIFYNLSSSYYLSEYAPLSNHQNGWIKPSAPKLLRPLEFLVHFELLSTSFCWCTSHLRHTIRVVLVGKMTANGRPILIPLVEARERCIIFYYIIVIRRSTAVPVAWEPCAAFQEPLFISDRWWLELTLF